VGRRRITSQWFRVSPKITVNVDEDILTELRQMAEETGPP